MIGAIKRLRGKRERGENRDERYGERGRGKREGETLRHHEVPDFYHSQEGSEDINI